MNKKITALNRALSIEQGNSFYRAKIAFEIAKFYFETKSDSKKAESYIIKALDLLIGVDYKSLELKLVINEYYIKIIQDLGRMQDLDKVKKIIENLTRRLHNM